MIRQSKESAMMEKALFTASEIAANDVVNTASVRNTVNGMDSLLVTRLTVTDQSFQTFERLLSLRAFDTFFFGTAIYLHLLVSCITQYYL